MLKKAPVSLECKVTEIKNYATHDMFMAEIVNVNIDDRYLTEDNRLALEKAGLLVFAHGRYYTMGRDLGGFGFSVDRTKENKTKPRKSKFMEILKIEQQIKEGARKIKEGRHVERTKSVRADKPKPHRPFGGKNPVGRASFGGKIRGKPFRGPKKQNKKTPQ